MTAAAVEDVDTRLGTVAVLPRNSQAENFWGTCMEWNQSTNWSLVSGILRQKATANVPVKKKEKNDPPPFLLQESELLLACERTGQESRWHASNG